MGENTERLREELRDTLELVRLAGGGVVFEEFPGDLEDDVPPAETLAGCAGQAPDARLETQRKLIAEANRLAETLDRLRGGAA